MSGLDRAFVCLLDTLLSVSSRREYLVGIALDITELRAIDAE